METADLQHTDTIAIGKPKRMEWLDAMRGFTMILVVAYHVAQMSFGESEKTSSSLPFLVLFRMPLFFFVSGFLAYKKNFLWNASNVGKLAWKKLKIQVLPALIFLCIFIILRVKSPFGDAFVKAMQSPTKDGYWFTWVLLLMFLIYYITEWSTQWIKSRWIPITLLMILSLFLYETTYLPRIFSFPKEDWMKWSSLIELMKFMPYFVMGNIVHRYWPQVQRVMDSPWFFPLVTALAFLSCAEIFKWHTLRFAWTNLPRTLAVYSLLTMVVMFFRHYADWFTQQKPIGRALQYIGTRTLDVYLLHFIMLPTLPQVGAWLNTNRPNFILSITLSVGMALLVIAFCLLVSNLLRISPLFQGYLFGRPNK